jgi:hypothetical protein
MGRRPLPKWITPFVLKPLAFRTSWGISSPFELLSPASGQVTNALLTRSPLGVIANPSFDLHVLGTPPAFILSQDQTLRKKFMHPKMRISTLLQFLAPYHSSVVKVHLSQHFSETKRRCLYFSTSARQTEKAPTVASDAFASCEVVSDLPYWTRPYV